MSNLGRIYEFLSKATASPMQLAAMGEYLRLPCGLAGVKPDERVLWHDIRQRPPLMSVIALASVHAE